VRGLGAATGGEVRVEHGPAEGRSAWRKREEERRNRENDSLAKQLWKIRFSIGSVK
jgi:hypothetical protein